MSVMASAFIQVSIKAPAPKPKKVSTRYCQNILGKGMLTGRVAVMHRIEENREPNASAYHVAVDRQSDRLAGGAKR